MVEGSQTQTRLESIYSMPCALKLLALTNREVETVCLQKKPHFAECWLLSREAVQGYHKAVQIAHCPDIHCTMGNAGMCFVQ